MPPSRGAPAVEEGSEVPFGQQHLLEALADLQRLELVGTADHAAAQQISILESMWSTQFPMGGVSAIGSRSEFKFTLETVIDNVIIDGGHIIGTAPCLFERALVADEEGRGARGWPG